MAQADGVELDDTKWQQILKAREYYEEHAVVPPIRKFSKYLGEDQKAMFKIYVCGDMLTNRTANTANINPIHS